MRILLDENLPRKRVAALRAEGHDVESIHTLKLQGLENGKLYEFARDSFDLCFTRDAGFAHNVRQGVPPSHLKLVRVTLHKSRKMNLCRILFQLFAQLIGPNATMAMTGRIHHTVLRKDNQPPSTV